MKTTPRTDAEVGAALRKLHDLTNGPGNFAFYADRLVECAEKGEPMKCRGTRVEVHKPEGNIEGLIEMLVELVTEPAPAGVPQGPVTIAEVTRELASTIWPDNFGELEILLRASTVTVRGLFWVGGDTDRAVEVSGRGPTDRDALALFLDRVEALSL